MLARLTAAFLIWASTGAAFAQPSLSPAEAKELACISENLIRQNADAALARFYASGDAEGDGYQASVEAMDAAMVACQQQYGWSDERTNLAAEIGMFQAVLDNFSIALSGSKGVSDAAFDQIGLVLTAMPAADRALLLHGGWREDDALTKRIAESLTAAGLPNDSTVLAFAFLIMEAKLVITYGTMDWVKLRD